MFGGMPGMPGMPGMRGDQQQQGGMPGMMGGMPGMPGMGGGMPGMGGGMPGMGGGMPGMMGGMPGMPGMGGDQQQQQGGMPGMMGGMPGMGGGMPGMGGMMGGMMGGGGSQQPQDPNNHGAFTNLFADHQPDAPAPATGAPQSASTFKCNVQIEASMMPGMVMNGNMRYELPKLRQRTEWEGGWEVESHTLGWKVRQEGEDQDPKATEINPDKDQFPQYTVPPFAQYQGLETVAGKLCHRYYFDFMGVLKGTLWVTVPAPPAEVEEGAEADADKDLSAVSFPVFSDINMMGMQIRMLMTDHELVEGFDDSYFDVGEWCPPRGVPCVVQGYARDATNNRPISGVAVQFTPSNGQAVSEAMSATTNGQGKFMVTIPACEYNISFTKDGYFASEKLNIKIETPIAPGTFADGILCPVLQEPEMRCVLRWNASPRDLDFYARRDDNSTICYFSKKYGSTARLDVDITTSFGPETLTITNHDEPVNVWVKQFSTGGRLVGCGATVDVYDHTGKIHTVAIPAEEGEEGVNPTGRWWYVCRCEGGEVEIKNQIM